MRKTDKVQAKFSYLFEPAYSIIYYSFTFLILCVAIIISCEITAVAKSSIILGVIFILLFLLPLTNKIYIQEKGLWIHSLFFKDYGIYFTQIKNYQITKHKVIINSSERNFIGYLSKRKAEELQAILDKEVMIQR